VALNEVTVERIADPERELQVDPVAGAPLGQGGPVRGLLRQVGEEPALIDRDGRQAGPAHADRPTHVQPAGGLWPLDDQPRAWLDDSAQLDNPTIEHTVLQFAQSWRQAPP
jgi:hypothetical protein